VLNSLIARGSDDAIIIKINDFNSIIFKGGYDFLRVVGGTIIDYD